MTRYQAFRFLTRCLALRPCDTGEVDRLKVEIVSGLVDWGKVVDLASHHYMIVALAVAFREPQLTAVLAEDVLEYFEEIHDLSAVRNQRICEQVIEIARALNSIGVEPVLLKGAANLIAGLYSDPASRFMRDIDVLVTEAQVGECFQKLLQEGYVPMDGYEASDGIGQVPHPARHATPLRKKGRVAFVELHRRFAERPGESETASEEIRRNSKPIIMEGAKFHIPCATDRATLAIAHSYLHHEVYRLGAVSFFRDFHDLLLLNRASAPTLDWAEIIHRFQSQGHEPLLRRCVTMTGRVFGEPNPASTGLLPAGPSDWHRFLFQVSYPGTSGVCLFLVQEVFRTGGLLKNAVSATETGRQTRRKLLTPSFYRRHLLRAWNPVKKSLWR